MPDRRGVFVRLLRRAVRLHGDALDNADAAVRADEVARSHREHIAKQIAAIRSPQPAEDK